MTTSARVDYDAIAHLYDAQPHREKGPDPELSAFIGQRAGSATLSILDVGCGTGNQLVANRAVAPQTRLVGLDRSLGMLRQARPKASGIGWVQADAAFLPFPAESFDFVACQHAFHHIGGKQAMLQEMLEVLRPGGRFVLHSLCPQESGDWLYYEYFPEARPIDLVDFWSPQAIIAAMEAVGFVEVASEPRHIHFEQDLREWLSIVRRRDTCSQLTAIPDKAYTAGVRRLEQELADPGAAPVRSNHLCLVTIRGEKRIRSPER